MAYAHAYVSDEINADKSDDTSWSDIVVYTSKSQKQFISQFFVLILMLENEFNYSRITKIKISQNS